MKKFLSILLALAVGFTFTFGSAMSAFAAAKSTETTTVTSYTDAVTVAYNEAKATIDANYNSYVSKLKGTYTISGITGVTDGEIVDASVLKAGADEVKDNYYTDLSNARKDGYKTIDVSAVYDGTALVSGKTWADLKDAYVDGLGEWTITNAEVVALSNKAFMKGLFDATKADTLAKLNLVDVSSYSDAVICKEDPYKTTHIAAATDIKNELIKTVNETVLTETDTDDADSYTKIAAKIADIQDIKEDEITGDSKSLGTDGKYYKYLLVSPVFVCDGTTHALKTTEEVKADDEKEGIDKTADLSTVTSRAAAYKQAAYTAYTASGSQVTKAQYEAAIAEADAYVEVWTEIINNGTYTTVGTFDYTSPTTAYTGYADAYKQAVKDATAYKQAVEIDGTVKYDASVIDKNLAEVKTKIYNQAAGVSYTYNSSALIDGAAKAVDLAWEKSVKLAALNNAEKDDLYNAKGEDLYYEIEKAKVIALYDEVEAKINAAATIEQLNSISPAVTIPGTVMNKTAVNAYIASLATFTAEAAKVQTALDDINEAAGAKYSWNDNYIALDTAELAKFYAEKGARTGSEIKALLADAKAWAASQPTVAAIAANKAELEEKIKSLPVVITLADKAAVKEVAAAVDAGLATPSNMGTLTAAINAVKTAEEAAIDKLIKGLDYNKITVADKAAAKAIVEAIDAYADETLYDTHVDYSTARNNYFTAMRDADKAAVIAAIAALPENATAAQVEAVKAQYDEFVKEYTDANAPAYNAADYITNYSRLEYAIKAAEAANKFTDADAKAYVFDQTIKATSVKLSAKKVKVTANFDASKLVENGYTVEYKFYKSTKKSSGYKYTGVTKVEDAKTYTNTNAKKGKNYYKFKVVVKNADGTVILTTALKDCKYALRTIK